MSLDLRTLLGGTTFLIIVSTVITVALTVGVAVLVRRFVRNAVGPDRETLTNGVPARAKILGVQQTGLMVNYQPQVLLQLEVQPAYGMPYQASTKAVIPLVNIPQFQPGAEVPVKVHPSDRAKVVLDLYG